MATEPRRIGILAGGGRLPVEVAESLVARGAAVKIVAIAGEADQDWRGYSVTRVKWGQIGAMMRALQDFGATELVIAGHVKRPDLTEIRPDLGGLAAILDVMSLIASGGDDSLLRTAVRYFERKGIRVIGAGEAAPEVLIGAGLLGRAPLPDGAFADIALGFDVIRETGRHDIGQAVVVTNGRLEAVEAVEGTDRMLDRVGARRRADESALAKTERRGVLVKRPKPSQELRVDLPVIGPDTVRRAAAAGLAGIAVEQGKTIALEREKLIGLADLHGRFLYGAEDKISAVAGAKPAPPLARVARTFEAAGERRVGKRAAGDIARGLDVLATFEPFGGADGVVVARRHVLAVGMKEGALSLISRAHDLHQWGVKRWRRSGIAVISDASGLDTEVLEAAARAGLEGVAVASDGCEGARVTEAAQTADSLGLVLALSKAAQAGTGGVRPLLAPGQAAVDEASARVRDGSLSIFIVAGEPSGDALGAALMRAVRDRAGDRVRYAGVGGAAMEREGLRSLFPLSDVAVVGAMSILKHLPRLVRRVYQTVDAAIAAAPDVVVIIDSPEFTHPIAKRIRRRRPEIPIIDYVSPSVWAWRPGRASQMRAYVDHVLALLPFEPAAHARLGGPSCTYIGHPLAERTAALRALDPSPLAASLGLDRERPVLVVLPGSRRSEVARMQGAFRDAVAALVQRGIRPEIIVPVVGSVRDLVEKDIQSWPLRPHLVSAEDEKLMAFRLADAALAASGTVTLELAVTGTPAVVGYKVDPLLAPLLRRALPRNIPTVVLANLVAGENIYPEFLQEPCAGNNLADALAPLLLHGAERDRQLAALARIPERLAIPRGTPTGLAAEIVLDYADRRHARSEAKGP